MQDEEFDELLKSIKECEGLIRKNRCPGYIRERKNFYIYKHGILYFYGDDVYRVVDIRARNLVKICLGLNIGRKFNQWEVKIGEFKNEEE